MDKILTQEAYFLRPFISILDEESLVNIFSIDQNKPYLDRNYFILHESITVERTIKLIEFYSKQEGYVKYCEYKINNKFYYCFIFKPRKNFINYYEQFISNNHTEIPKEIKYMINSYWIKLGIIYNLFSISFKASSIPHNDYMEDISDMILQQFADYENRLELLDTECTTE